MNFISLSPRSTLYIGKLYSTKAKIANYRTLQVSTTGHKAFLQLWITWPQTIVHNLAFMLWQSWPGPYFVTNKLTNSNCLQLKSRSVVNCKPFWMEQCVNNRGEHICSYKEKFNGIISQYLLPFRKCTWWVIKLLLPPHCMVSTLLTKLWMTLTDQLLVLHLKHY